MASNINIGLKGTVIGIVLAIALAILLLVVNVIGMFIFTKYSDQTYLFTILDLLMMLLFVAAALVAGIFAGKAAASSEGADPAMAAAFSGLFTGIVALIMYSAIQAVQLLAQLYLMNFAQTTVWNFQTPYCLFGTCCAGPAVLILCVIAAVFGAAMFGKKKP